MTEREWREASDMRKSTATFATIVVAAAVLALLVARRRHSLFAERRRTGDHGPCASDDALRRFQPAVLRLSGFLHLRPARGRVPAVSERSDGRRVVRRSREARPEQFYLWGRAVTATLGTATVALVYFIGLRWGTRTRSLAASLMAVMPLHVRESHYVLTDVPVTFFVTLTFLLALRAQRTGARHGVSAGRCRRRSCRSHEVHRCPRAVAAADRRLDDARRHGHRVSPVRLPQSAVPGWLFFWRRRTRCSTCQGFSTGMPY